MALNLILRIISPSLRRVSPGPHVESIGEAIPELGWSATLIGVEAMGQIVDDGHRDGLVYRIDRIVWAVALRDHVEVEAVPHPYARDILRGLDNYPAGKDQRLVDLQHEDIMGM